MSKVLTKSEYLQLIGLQTLGAKHQSIVNDCEDAMAALLGVEKEKEFLFELFSGDVSMSAYMDANSITVGAD